MVEHQLGSNICTTNKCNMKNESKFSAQLKTTLKEYCFKVLHWWKIICWYAHNDKQTKETSNAEKENIKVYFHHHQNIFTFKFIDISTHVCISPSSPQYIYIYVAVGPIMLIEYGRVKQTLSLDPACQWKWELYKLVKPKIHIQITGTENLLYYLWMTQNQRNS